MWAGDENSGWGPGQRVAEVAIAAAGKTRFAVGAQGSSGYETDLGKTGT